MCAVDLSNGVLFSPWQKVSACIHSKRLKAEECVRNIAGHFHISLINLESSQRLVGGRDSDK